MYARRARGQQRQGRGRPRSRARRRLVHFMPARCPAWRRCIALRRAGGSRWPGVVAMPREALAADSAGAPGGARGRRDGDRVAERAPLRSLCGSNLIARRPRGRARQRCQSGVARWPLQARSWQTTVSSAARRGHRRQVRGCRSCLRGSRCARSDPDSGSPEGSLRPRP